MRSMCKYKKKGCVLCVTPKDNETHEKTHKTHEKTQNKVRKMKWGGEP